MIRKERKTWWALLLVAALLISLLPTAVLAENGSAGSGVDYTVSPDADTPEQKPVEEEPEEPEEEEPVEEPEEELIEDVALQMIAPLSMPRAATTSATPNAVRDISGEERVVAGYTEEEIEALFPVMLKGGAKLTLEGITVDYSTKYPGCSPISVEDGATATIIIDGNVTLKGGNASGITGAAPAIHVPEGSTLYIESTGEREADGTPKDSLTVYGGNAAKGGDGTTAAWGSCGSGYTWYGGQGGEGGGGAAPAIGGKGGTGGPAPERQAPMYNGSAVTYSTFGNTIQINFTGKVGADADSDVIVANDKLKNPSEWKFNPLPTTVNGGTTGSQGTGAGNVYITGSLTLSGSGGNSAAGGKGGDGNDGKDGTANNPGNLNNFGGRTPNEVPNVIFSAHSVDGSSDSNSSASAGAGCFVFFSGGGGGGGGGGGCAAPLIGTGGAGGSSGGSGAPPVVNYFSGLADDHYNSGETIESTTTPGGAGGGGGWPNGGGGGGGGAATRLDNASEGPISSPGKGGASGQAGTAGTDVTGNTLYQTMFGDNAGKGGAGGSSGSSGVSTSTGAAGGAKVESSYYNYPSKTYTFPAGGRGGVATGSKAYTPNKNIVLSTGVKKGNPLSSGSGYPNTLFGGGYGYSGVQPKVPIGIYDLADCTLTVLSRETETDTAGATTQTYTGHNYAPKLNTVETIQRKHVGLQITVSYSATEDGTALLNHITNKVFPVPDTETIQVDGGEEAYSFLGNFGITESSAAVNGHSTLINVGDTYQISGLPSQNAVSRYLTNGGAVAVGTWTDTLQITQVTLNSVSITAKENSTDVGNGAFLTSIIKTGNTPKVTLNYKWSSDGTNFSDNLWLLLSKEYDNKNSDATMLQATWTVTKPGSTTAEQFAATRISRSGSGSTATMIVQRQSTEGEWGFAEPGGVTPEKGETGTGAGTTTTGFQIVSTSSASYTFAEPGEYTFTLTLSGMGYTAQTATFTVKVKQQIEVIFGGAGQEGKKGSTADDAWNVHPNQTMTITANGLPAGATATLTLVYPYHNTVADNAGVFKRVVGEASAGSPFSYTPTNDIVEGQNGGTTVQVYINVTGLGDYVDYYQWTTTSVPAIDNDSSYDKDLPTIYVTMHNYANAGNDGFCTVEMVNGTTTTTCGEYQPAETGNGGHYQITNAGQLYWYAALWNGDNTHAHWGTDVSPAGAELTTDINLASTHNPNKVTDGEGDIVGYEWIPIARAATVSGSSGQYSATGAFTGSFSGAGHTISGLYISERYYNSRFNGFFAAASGNAQISNFTLEGTIKAPSNSSGNSGDTGIGSVVGWGANFKLEDVTSEVNISGSELYHVGGLVGCTRGESSAKSSITRCIYEGTISLTSSTDSIGGIAGCAHWVDISYSANRGSISTTAGGGSTHPDLVGGIAGQLENGSIKNCYSSAIPTQGDANMGGLIGTLRTGTTVENSVYLSDTDAIVNDKSGGENHSPQSHTGLTPVSDFSTGKACYLANGSTDAGTWRQNLDNAAATANGKKDDYPRLAREFDKNTEPADAAKVYQMPDKATYSNKLPVYSVDVSWGSMLFTYQQGEWKPDKHDYEGNWQDATADVNQVTVANNSDWKVNASVQFEAVDAFADKVMGTITFGNENWSGQVLDAQKSGTATLQLSRKPNTTSLLENDFGSETSTKVGTVTVTITPGSYNN